MGNDRGQYGRPHVHPYIGAEPMARNLTPWIIGGLGVAIVGLAVIGSQAATKQRSQLTPHDKEVRAWEAEFPGLGHG